MNPVSRLTRGGLGVVLNDETQLEVVRTGHTPSIYIIEASDRLKSALDPHVHVHTEPLIQPRLRIFSGDSSWKIPQFIPGEVVSLYIIGLDKELGRIYTDHIRELFRK